jgi:hypothetical protein
MVPIPSLKMLISTSRVKGKVFSVPDVRFMPNMAPMKAPMDVPRVAKAIVISMLSSLLRVLERSSVT